MHNFLRQFSFTPSNTIHDHSTMTDPRPSPFQNSSVSYISPFYRYYTLPHRKPLENYLHLEITGIWRQ